MSPVPSGDASRRAELRRRRLQAGVRALDGVALEDAGQSDDNPVFVCAVGWRCGSTLMQRLLMTDPSILVWGEPMDRLQIVDHLVQIVSGVSADWPPAGHYYSHRPGVDRVRAWVANLAPDAGDLKAGLRALLDGWLAAPARRRGFARWGVKEVRWSGDQALLLRWLYPRARFVVLTRHPVMAYRSLARQGLGDGGGGWWIRWPDRHVSDLETFAAYWNELALSWAHVADELGASVVRYEELVGGRFDFEAFAARLGLALAPETALAAQVTNNRNPYELTREEVTAVNALTAQGRAVFRYGD